MSDTPDPRIGVRRVPVSERPNKVSSGDFAVPPPGGSGAFGQFYDSLPNILAADSLRAVARGVASAVARDRGVVWMLGGHVVKTGLSVVLIDLMERGAITLLAWIVVSVIFVYESGRG